MKKLPILLVIIGILILAGCNTTGTGEIQKYWNGYLSSLDGQKIKVTINFTGKQVMESGIQMLKAEKLTITGEDFTQNIEFKSPDGEKSSKSWIFTTKSSNTSYPYGIISISQDFKDITGQIPTQASLSTFYSVDDNATV